MNRSRAVVAALLVVSLAKLASGEGETAFALKDGDRVVFYGDSITDQRLYTTFVETYVVTRFPKLDVRFVHSGWGGDRVTGGGGGKVDERLERDVFAWKPTVVTVMLGMNDAGVRPFDAKLFETFSTGYRHIVSSVRTRFPEARLTLLEPSPYDDVTRPPGFEGGYNAVLQRYGQFVRQLAAKEGQDTADLNSPVVAALARANATDAKLAQKIVADRVHPGASGHLVMAAALLEAWHAPATVTAVGIDAAAHAVTLSERTAVTGLTFGKTVEWTQADEALPMPIDLRDPATALVVSSSPVVALLEQETLRVTGLEAPTYLLEIDGEKVGEWTAAQLASGINVALAATPMARQAAQVHALTLEHNELHYTRWRRVQVPLQKGSPPSLERALEALDALEEDLVRSQHVAARPKPHAWKLVPRAFR